MTSFDDHQLKLALAYHLVETIVTADGEVQAGEAKYMDMLFPHDVLLEEGFCDRDAVLTSHYEEARTAALLTLPGKLPLAEKLEILTMCLDASLSDDHADAYELVHVRVAARLLGLSDAELDTHLESLSTVGTLDVDDLVLDVDIETEPPPRKI